jgi:phosphatidylserine/phosphatidylglycerophosphate/cardiolipin synthase-like enzyme
MIKGGFLIKMPIVFLILFMVLILNQNISAGEQNHLVINEIMYNPIKDDNYYEWVEIYNPLNYSINLSGWSITDNHGTDILEVDNERGNGSTIIVSNGYALITDQGTKIYDNITVDENVTLLKVDDKSIGNGLGNMKDKLILKNSTGCVIDAVEWGYDYDDINGTPASTGSEGKTLARYPNMDSDNTSVDFFESNLPTPGSNNSKDDNKLEPGSFDIECYPLFIAKTYENSQFSIPFASKISLNNYPPNQYYSIKAYVVKELSDSQPASQTWDGQSWIYSNYYVYDICTCENGNWSSWIYLRLNKNYKEYQNNLKNNDSAYLCIKIKNENETSLVSKKIFLLDMDESTCNGTKGGCVCGIITNNESKIENSFIMLENKTGIVTGIYKTEDNEIDCDFISNSGYYKLPSPVDVNYSLRIFDENLNTFLYKSNINIEKGRYGLSVEYPDTSFSMKIGETIDIEMGIQNTGNFNDTFLITIHNVSQGWIANIEKSEITLKSFQEIVLNLTIEPYFHYYHRFSDTYVKIKISSINDPDVSYEFTFSIELDNPDLFIKEIKLYNEGNTLTSEIGEGETFRIKAFLKNLGNEVAKNVVVKVFYDTFDKEHFIGEKKYESVSKYQKYPYFKWDTSAIKPGIHKIIVIVDMENKIIEIDETNNLFSYEVTIIDTTPEKYEKRLLITEIYYHNHPGIENEYISIYNPTNISINLSRWYITNSPFKTKDAQPKITFPFNTKIQPKSLLYITQNASAFLRETGNLADFEYLKDSSKDIQQMDAEISIYFSNNGGFLVLKDQYNHTIDFCAYGDINCSSKAWHGTTIPKSGEGKILKRKFHQDIPVDTNSSLDWMQPRVFGIGQSNHPLKKIISYGIITAFVSPDCSYSTIKSELRKAKYSIYVNMYEFTNYNLCEEIISAIKRNVSINLFLEKSPIGGISDKEKYILNKINSYGGKIRFIGSNQSCKIYSRYPFNHGKYIIIDDKTVIIESCNWADSGVPIDPSYGNREWGIVIKNEDTADYFLNVFMNDWDTIYLDIYNYSDINFGQSIDFLPEDKKFSGYYKPFYEPQKITGNFSAYPLLSPDNSFGAICDLIDSAKESILIEQLYIYNHWEAEVNPFIEKLKHKAKQGVEIKVIMNFNPYYDDTNKNCNMTKKELEDNGIKVKFIYTNWTYFSNVHNKGVIVDNKSVLISSINWNYNSVMSNREAGIIIENNDIAKYYASVFFYDWNLMEQSVKNQTTLCVEPINKNTIYIVGLFTMTFILVARDWRKRKWN